MIGWNNYIFICLRKMSKSLNMRSPPK